MQKRKKPILFHLQVKSDGLLDTKILNFLIYAIKSEPWYKYISTLAVVQVSNLW